MIRKSYCARCKRVVPVMVTSAPPGARDRAACMMCLHTWPVGAVVASTRRVETVYCQTCQKPVIAEVERYLKGTAMGRCSTCGSILHPKAKR